MERIATMVVGRFVACLVVEVLQALHQSTASVVKRTALAYIADFVDMTDMMECFVVATEFDIDFAA